MPNLFDDIEPEAPPANLFADIKPETEPRRSFSERAIEPTKEIYGQAPWQPYVDKLPTWARAPVQGLIDANPIATIEKGGRAAAAIGKGFLPGALGAGVAGLGGTETQADQAQREAQHVAEALLNFPFMPSSTRVPRAHAIEGRVPEARPVEEVTPPRPMELNEAAPAQPPHSDAPNIAAPAPPVEAEPNLFADIPPAKGPAPPAPDTVRLYHGGQPESREGGGGRWVTPDENYARDWAGETGQVYYVDVPKDSPLLKKSYEDAGTDQIAPPVAFEAPEEIAKKLKPLEAHPAIKGGEQTEIKGRERVEEPDLFDDVPAEEPPAWVTERIPEEAVPAAPKEAVPAEPVAPEPVETRAPPVEPPAAPAEPELVKPKGRKPQTLTEYIAANGGIEKTGETRDLGLPGYVVRKNGKSIDGFWRERLMEEGYLEPEPDGSFSRDIRGELTDKLAREASGEPQYSAHDRGELELRENYAAAKERKEELERHRDAILEDAENYGLFKPDIKKADLDYAAELLYRGEETDPTTALEKAFDASRERLEATNERAPDSGVVREGSEGVAARRQSGPFTFEEASSARPGKAGEVSQPANKRPGIGGENPAYIRSAQEHLRGAFERKTGTADVSPVGTVSLRRAVDSLDLSHLTGVSEKATPAFATRIKNVAGDVPIHFISPEDMARWDKDRPIAKWVEENGRDFILIDAAEANNSANAAHMVLHEGAHAAALGAIERNPVMKKSIRALMDEAAKKFTADHPAFINEHEFISEAIGNPAVQKALHETPAPPDLAARLGGKGKIRTMWDGFVEIIRRALGLSPNMRNLLEATLKVAEEATRTKQTVPVITEAGMARQKPVAKTPASTVDAVARAEERSEKKGNEVRRQLQDRMLPAKQVVEELEKSHGKLADEKNPYQAEAIMHGRIGQRINEFKDKFVDPLLDAIKDGKLKIDEVGEYLQALNAPFRNRKISLRTEGANKAGSGMSSAVANAIVAKVENGPQAAEFKAVSDAARKMADEELRVRVEGGLMTKKQAAALIQTEPYYVPHKADIDAAGEGWRSGLSKGIGVKGKEHVAALGRSTRADNPIPFMIEQGQHAIRRAENDRVVRAFADMIRDNPIEGLWSVDKARTERFLNKQTGLVEERTVSNSLADKEHVVPFKENGEQHFIRFEGEYGKKLAKTLNNMDALQLHDQLKRLGTVTRAMARLSTTYNPAFGPINFLRDLGEATLNISEFGPKVVGNFAKNVPMAIAGSYQALLGKSGKWADIFREFDREGGRVHFMALENAEVISKRINRDLEAMAGNKKAQTAVAFRKVGEALEFFNDVLENATRVAAYQAMKDSGMTAPKAAFEARELTLNFTRKGELGSGMSALWMFSNAGAQGSARMARTLTTKGGQAAVGALGAATALLTLSNIYAGGKDEDGKTYYSKIPDYVRDNALTYVIPGTKGKYVAIPFGFGFGAIKTAFERTMEMFLDPKAGDKKDQMGHIALNTIGAFNPLGSDKNPVSVITPSVLRPGVQAYINKNFRNTDIVPQYEHSKNIPESQKSFRNTSPVFKKTAEGLNELSGGTTKRSGYIDVSPELIKHFLQAATGGAGTTLTQIGGMISKGVTGQEQDISDIPVARRLTGQVGFKDDQREYFEERTKVERAAKQQIDGPERRAAIAFKSADRQRGMINKQMDRIRADTSLSVAAKDKQLKMQEERLRKIMNGARKQLYRFREGKTLETTE